ncbi:APC family permease [Rhodococcus sp. NPDC056960]|uniref:APC family permease n=1 Tax=Rhodococcus sp. NPDC056960 TaxID=3345982 RepID=UPI00364294D6
MSTEDPVRNTTYEASDRHLKRTIGLFSLIGLAVSIQVGSGWLLATLAAVAMAGPAAIIAWIVAAVFFAVIGVSWMELGTMLPRSGGGVRYPRLTHGAFVSWINGWGYLIAVIALPVIEAQAAITYIGGHWPELDLISTDEGTTMLKWPLGILAGMAALLFFFALNAFGAKLMTESNKFVTIWKLVVPTVTFIFMFTAFDSSNFHAFGGFAPMGVGAVLGAVAGGGIVFAFSGVRQVVDFGGEVINPRRNIPIAILVGGILIPLVLFLLLQIAFIGAIDWSAIHVHPAAGATEWVPITPGDWGALLGSDWASAPLLSAVGAAGFGWFALVLLSDAVLSPAATGWVFLGMGGRTAYSMSVNSELPLGLQKMNRWGTPWVALTVCTTAGFFLFLPVPSWYQFVGMVGTALVLSYLIAGPCIGVFRRLCPELPRPVRVPGGHLFGVAGFVCALLLVYFAGWVTLINVTTIVLLGLPIYAAYSSVLNGWSPKAASTVLAVAFGAAWMYVNIDAGWLAARNPTSHGHWPIGLYMTVFVLLTAAFVTTLWAISTRDGRKQIRSGLWILPTLIVTTFVSYFGDNGPAPTFTNGTDMFLVVAVAVAIYFWAVREGYRTPELEQVVYNTLREEREEQPEPAV